MAGLKRGGYLKVVERNRELAERIRGIKAEHPFWGYRRGVPERSLGRVRLKFAEGLTINKKRVLCVMRSYGLTVRPDERLKALRTAGRPKPRPAMPNQWWGIDMTKVLAEKSGWVYIVVVLDWYTKKIVGYRADERSTSGDWKKALDMAVNRQFPEGARDRGLSLMSDNGCQPTSVAFMKACGGLGIHQAGAIQ